MLIDFDGKVHPSCQLGTLEYFKEMNNWSFMTKIKIFNFDLCIGLLGNLLIFYFDTKINLPALIYERPDKVKPLF